MEASKAALVEEMQRDDRVWALGEDLGRGGVFGQYTGLAELFGSERIVDAPISEAAIMGTAVGAAMTGTRPVVEMRFSDFALCAIDELVNQAAKARYMFGGQTRVPLVAREPVGMWRSSAAQHSQSLESWYTHIPGLVVVMPSTPADNKGLLKTAIRSDDPVVYMEHKDLWPLQGEVPDGEHLVPFGSARVVRAGTDITIVSWSKTVHTANEAAGELAARGIATKQPASWPPGASRPRSSTCAHCGHGMKRRYSPRSPEPAACWSPTKPWASRASAPKSSPASAKNTTTPCAPRRGA